MGPLPVHGALPEDFAVQDEPDLDQLAPSPSPFLNPFKHTAESDGSGGFDLMPSIMEAVDILPSSGDTERKTEKSISPGTVATARKVCGQIAEMFINMGNPDTIQFPTCPDITVINETLQQMANTPLGLGYGNFPESVSRAWGRFTKEISQQYRESQHMEPVDLVPVRIELPEWLEHNTNFEILSGCALMDIEIVGAVNSTIAKGIKHSRVTVRGKVGTGAQIGAGAIWSSFIFEDDMEAMTSFSRAQNVLIHFKGNHKGEIGTVLSSRVICDGSFEGRVNYQGMGCSFGPNVSSWNR